MNNDRASVGVFPSDDSPTCHGHLLSSGVVPSGVESGVVPSGVELRGAQVKAERPGGRTLATFRLPSGETYPDVIPACYSHHEPGDDSNPTAGEPADREEEEDSPRGHHDQRTVKELSYVTHIHKYRTVEWRRGYPGSSGTRCGGSSLSPATWSVSDNPQQTSQGKGAS